MKRSLTAEELLREMRSSVTPVDSPETTDAMREDIVERMRDAQAAMRREKSRATSLRLRASLAAAIVLPALAAAATLYVTGHARTQAAVSETRIRALSGHVDVVHGGHPTETSVGIDTILGPGDAVHTEDGARAWISLPSGTTVQADIVTDLLVNTPEKSERVDLELGRVDVSVPKLGPGRTMSVRTPNALVTVHGTRFSVLVLRSADRSVETQVKVAEGVVSVERDGRSIDLYPGASWSSADSSKSAGDGQYPPSARSTSEDRASIPTEPARDDHRAGNSLAAASRVLLASAPAADTAHPPSEARFGDTATSTLPEENRIIEQAMVASRNGDDAKAIRLLDSLLARFPHSVLKENAEVERFRAMRRLGRVTEASREARRYLAEHPDGMERDEAKHLAVEATASPDSFDR